MSSYPCVGIDLGTTYSALAVINAAGRPEIVPNSEGDRTTRSAVFFQEEGSVIVGELAPRNIGLYPDRVKQWIKRDMGNANMSFSVNGKKYSAIELSSMILKKIKKDSEARLGSIKYAVVTVPAYFDEVRRTATIDAAKLAGLDVLEIINEPTAAAITYATTGGRPGTVLVYDFGGGTFDVTILKMKDVSEITVLSTEGDHKLGGCDLDNRIAQYIVNKFKEEKNIKIEEDEKNGDWLEILASSERVKKELSKMSSTRCKASWGNDTITLDIDRTMLENLIEQEILRTQMLIENALMAAELSPEDIDEILLVGGSTRIPAVTKMLKKKFTKEPINHVNVDEAIAMGAAIKAGYLMNEKGLTDFTPEAAARVSQTRLKDVTAHSLGTLAMSNIDGVEKLRNHIMIPKNSLIPIKKTETFYTMSDNQIKVDCSVTQGEDTDPEFVNVILQKVVDLPSNRPAGCPIEVTYSYDTNGIMKFKFKDVQTGRTEDMESKDALRAQKHLEEIEADFEDLEIE